MVSSAFSSGIFASAMLMYGLFFNNTWILLVGVLGLISSVVIYRHNVKAVK